MALAEILTFDSPPAAGRDLVSAVHLGLVSALRVPRDDPTVWHQGIGEASSMVADRHGADAVLVRVTMFEGRTDSTIARFHREIADRLESIGVPRESVLVVIIETPPRLWSIAGVPQDQVDVGFEVEI